MSELLKHAMPDSWENIQGQLSTMLDQRVCPECLHTGLSLRETFDDHVIARCWSCDRMYQMMYSVTGDQAPTIVPGQMSLVETSYTPVKDYTKKADKPAAGETFEMPDVEIFSAGTWNGEPYTEQDLDDMVSTFNALKGKVDPPLKLGHSDAQKFMGQTDGAPALGWIKDLKRSGSKLLATFTGIPKAVYDLIQKGAYRKRSAEIWWNFREPSTGQIYRRALSGVALLGADLPAVSTLEDMVALYGREAGQPHLVTYTIGDPPADGRVVDHGIQIPTQNEGSETEMDAELKKKLDDAEARAAAAEQKLAERDAQTYSANVDAFLAQAKAEGKVVPAQEPLLKALAMALPRDGKHTFSVAGKEQEGSGLDLLKAYVGTMPKLVEFKEISAGAGTPDAKEAFEAKVKKFQAENPKADYADAVVAVGKEDPELLAAYREATDKPDTKEA